MKFFSKIDWSQVIRVMRVQLPLLIYNLFLCLYIYFSSKYHWMGSHVELEVLTCALFMEILLYIYSERSSDQSATLGSRVLAYIFLVLGIGFTLLCFHSSGGVIGEFNTLALLIFAVFLPPVLNAERKTISLEERLSDHLKSLIVAWVLTSLALLLLGFVFFSFDQLIWKNALGSEEYALCFAIAGSLFSVTTYAYMQRVQFSTSIQLDNVNPILNWGRAIYLLFSLSWGIVSAIITVYILMRIVWVGEMPKGEVAYIMGGYFGLSVVSLYLRRLTHLGSEGSAWLIWRMRILLPITSLLFIISATIRVQTYGWTEVRMGLVIFFLWMIGLSVALWVTKDIGKQLRVLIHLFLGGAVLVLTSWFGLSTEFTYRSQSNRLRTIAIDHHLWDSKTHQWDFSSIKVESGEPLLDYSYWDIYDLYAALVNIKGREVVEREFGKLPDEDNRLVDGGSSSYVEERNTYNVFYRSYHLDDEESVIDYSRIPIDPTLKVKNVYNFELDLLGGETYLTTSLSYEDIAQVICPEIQKINKPADEIKNEDVPYIFRVKNFIISVSEYSVHIPSDKANTEDHYQLGLLKLKTVVELQN